MGWQTADTDRPITLWGLCRGLSTHDTVARVTQWDEWREARPEPSVLHLDSAACGRSSDATLDAVAAHARLEARTGAYVAQDRAAAVLEGLRADLGGLLGMPATSVAFVESATAGLAALLRCWPLPPGARIGVLPVEWGPNLAAFEAAGYLLSMLPTDGTGALDLAAFEDVLDEDPPEVVHLTQVTSHRGLVQPVAEAAGLCRAAGVPLWVDVAQALGHVDTATGADALYGTSRKWLTGPRGVGVLAVAPHAPLAIPPSPMAGPDDPPLAAVESHEAHVAGRLGLAQAVREHLAAGPAAVHARLEQVGHRTRETLGGLRGWEVVGVASAITALRPLDGQDVFSVRGRLLAEHRILTTAGGLARAPRDLREPLLRISPHVDVTEAQLQRLGDALMTSA